MLIWIAAITLGCLVGGFVFSDVDGIKFVGGVLFFTFGMDAFYSFILFSHVFNLTGKNAQEEHMEHVFEAIKIGDDDAPRFNPSTGLRMISGGVDAGGYFLGEDPRRDDR